MTDYSGVRDFLFTNHPGRRGTPFTSQHPQRSKGYLVPEATLNMTTQPPLSTLHTQSSHLRHSRPDHLLVYRQPGKMRVSETPTRLPALGSSYSSNTKTMSPLLKLPGELRNKIYSLVAEQMSIINVFEGRTVLPPLGLVCRQVRREMLGVYEKELLSDPDSQIVARVCNMNFEPLMQWLDSNDECANFAWKDRARVLTIHATCIEDESERQFPWLGENTFQRSPMPDNERLPNLLLHNLATSINGWCDDSKISSAHKPEKDPCVYRKVATQKNPLARRPDFVEGYMDQRIDYKIHRRQQSGRHYWIAVIADFTWELVPGVATRCDTICNYPLCRNIRGLIFSALLFSRQSAAGDCQLAFLLQQACQYAAHGSINHAVLNQLSDTLPSNMDDWHPTFRRSVELALRAGFRPLHPETDSGELRVVEELQTSWQCNHSFEVAMTRSGLEMDTVDMRRSQRPKVSRKASRERTQHAGPRDMKRVRYDTSGLCDVQLEHQRKVTEQDLEEATTVMARLNLDD